MSHNEKCPICCQTQKLYAVQSDGLKKMGFTHACLQCDRPRTAMIKRSLPNVSYILTGTAAISLVLIIVWCQVSYTQKDRQYSIEYINKQTHQLQTLLETVNANYTDLMNYDSWLKQQQAQLTERFNDLNRRAAEIVKQQQQIAAKDTYLDMHLQTVIRREDEIYAGMMNHRDLAKQETALTEREIALAKQETALAEREAALKAIPVKRKATLATSVIHWPEKKSKKLYKK